jgi:chaperonin GroES
MATKKLSIVPLGDRIVLEPLSKEETSASGIIIPDTARQEKPERGTVLAVGAGKFANGALEPMTVRVGDVIIFSPYATDEIKIDGETYIVIAESSVLGIIGK